MERGRHRLWRLGCFNTFRTQSAIILTGFSFSIFQLSAGCKNYDETYGTFLPHVSKSSFKMILKFCDFFVEVPCLILGYDEKHEGLRGFLQPIQTNIEIISQKYHEFFIHIIFILLTFQSLAVSIRTTRFNIQKFYMVLALR